MAQALLPASLSSMHGCREDLSGGRRWAKALALPSLLGGGLRAVLRAVTPSAVIDHIVPLLVLGATTLLIVQRPLLRRIRGGEASPDDLMRRRLTPFLLGGQEVVGVCGGYFGAAWIRRRCGAHVEILAPAGLIRRTCHAY